MVIFLLLLLRVGFGYLTGELVVGTSTESTNTSSNYECYYSENMEDYYCPDPPEQIVDEFPSRP